MAMAVSSMVCKAGAPIEYIRHVMVIAAHSEALIQELRAHPDQPLDVALVQRLAPVAMLLKIVIPDIHQKIGEVIFAAEHPELSVCKHQHGADLKDDKGGRFEHKVSVVTNVRPRCNFNWPVPKGATPDERRKKLLDSVREKTAGGGAILEVKNGLGVAQATYRFSNEFLLDYFSRIEIGTSGNYNMGCVRCSDCSAFHRLQVLVDLQRKPAADRTRSDWAAVLGSVPIHCGVYKRQ